MDFKRKDSFTSRKDNRAAKPQFNPPKSSPHLRMQRKPDEYSEFADIKQRAARPKIPAYKQNATSFFAGVSRRSSQLTKRFVDVVRQYPKIALASLAGALLVAGLLIFGFSLDTKPGLNAEQIEREQATKPNFEVIAPDSVSVEGDVFFDPDEGVASYEDAIDEVTVAITQQPLTTEQLNNKDEELKNISDALLAETVFQSKYGEVYLAGPNEQTANTQVALFMTDQLLIIMRTNGPLISLQSWADYIDKTSG